MTQLKTPYEEAEWRHSRPRTRGRLASGRLLVALSAGVAYACGPASDSPGAAPGGGGGRPGPRGHTARHVNAAAGSGDHSRHSAEAVDGRRPVAGVFSSPLAGVLASADFHSASVAPARRSRLPAWFSAPGPVKPSHEVRCASRPGRPSSRSAAGRAGRSGHLRCSRSAAGPSRTEHFSRGSATVPLF